MYLLETECELDSARLGQEPVMGSCEHGNELSGFLKMGNFVTGWANMGLKKDCILFMWSISNKMCWDKEWGCDVTNIR
jgi:hypothetical protein